jgi:hypothetical protein
VVGFSISDAELLASIPHIINGYKSRAITSWKQKKRYFGIKEKTSC